MAGAAYVSSLQPLFIVLACVGFYVCLAPLLHLWPWIDHDQSSQPTGITAGHRIKAGGDIEAAGSIQAGHGIEAGGDIRTGSPRSALPSQPHSSLETSGLVNGLVGHYKIRMYAAPVENNEKATVFRVVIAADPRPTVNEFGSASKAALKEALAGSSLEKWGCSVSSLLSSNTPTEWTRASPNTGLIATFERNWATSRNGGSVLNGKATLQLPSGASVWVTRRVEPRCDRAAYRHRRRRAAVVSLTRRTTPPSACTRKSRRGRDRRRCLSAALRRGQARDYRA
jgi:hypothetical protein